MPSVHPARWNKSAWRCCAGRAAAVSAFFLLTALFIPRDAPAAEGISGYLDFGYNSFNTKSEDALGNESHSESNAITQRYSLTFTRSLAPYLRLYTSGLLDRVDNTSVANGARSESTATTIQPTVDLTLRSPVYTAGVRYNRNVAMARSGESPLTTDISDNYQGILGWKPPDQTLPSVEMRLVRSHAYDREKVFRDTVTDFAGLVADYSPTNKVTLRYRPSYVVSTNKLAGGLQTQSLTHAGMVQYGDHFFQNRLSIGTSYNVTYRELQVSGGGTGSVDISVAAFSGLSSLDDTPVEGALTPNSALNDGNLTAGSGINIGLPPLGGDVRERNIGLDFFIEKDVNRLLLWVDRPLPLAVVNSFSWSIYTSSDNVNWSFLTTVFPAPFGTFENRFEIDFSPVNARYIKIAVKPLSPAVNGASGFPDIFVTELQAFSRKPAEQVRGKTTSLSQVGSFDGTVMLLESNPSLYYRFSYLEQRTESSNQLSQRKWFLSNGLQAAHRFSKVFSGSAGVSRDDFADPRDNGTAYGVNTSLDAVPLPTLRHSFSYSGRIDKTATTGSRTNSFFLNNTAQVYSGVVLSASGGLNFRDDDTGRSSKGTDLSAAVNIQPHRTLGLNYQVTSTKAESSGGGSPALSTRSTSNSAGASYHPVETLYLAAAWTELSDPTRTVRLQSYGLNWSPFLGGSLQFAFSYSEGLSSDGNARNRTFGPSMTWRATRNASLSAQYQVSQSTSDTGKSDSNAISTALRVSF